ncbi:unnamed protein product [Allacma fusca]|uniref:Uncharacterized protein n=1 Tax=Allacma fusca TaxID=39272 RepID=A0A8J2NLQ6_9HEXA|nr:unnamed protein product [Allacma fusca]
MGNVTESFLLKAQIRGMVTNPIVRLFSGESLTGTSQDYHSGLNRLKELNFPDASYRVLELFGFGFNLDIVSPFEDH